MADAISYGTAKNKIKDDLDLHEESFIRDDANNPELMRLFNDAIEDCHACIINLHEDYFLDLARITLVAGTKEYSLPTAMYGDKIRLLMYSNQVTGSGDTAEINESAGGNKYAIEPIKDLEETMSAGSNDQYKYLIVSAAAGKKIRFYPTPQESGTKIFLYHIRNPTLFTTASTDAETVDIPEFINFIYAHVKRAVRVKEGIVPWIQQAEKELLFYKDLMETTLKQRILDKFINVIAPDLSFYGGFEDGGGM